ncbi:MAG: LamG domain-containing protein [Pirellulaceae bacterium]|nr:LamG domain-containing protein [Pirellulaceae bacterium]
MSSPNFALAHAPQVAGTTPVAVELPRVLVPSDSFTVELTATPRSLAPAQQSRALWSLAGRLELKQYADRWVFQHNNPTGTPKLEQVIAPIGEVGRPVRLAAVSTGQEMRLFVEGKLVESRKYAGPLPSTRGVPMSLASSGAGNSTYAPFDGTLDEIRLSSAARYDADYVHLARLETDASTLLLYHCDEGTGDVLRDSSGRGNDGKVNGLQWLPVDGALPEGSAKANALDFSPTLPVGAAHVLAAKPFDLRQPLTVEMVATPRALADERQSRPLCHFSGHFELKIFENALTWTTAGPMATYVSVRHQPVTVGQRMHLAGVSTGQEMQLFVDGKLIGSAPITVELTAEPRPVVLGFGAATPTVESGPGYRAFDGTIEQFRVSKFARYQRDFPPPTKLAVDPETVLLYDFSEGQGDTLADRSGHNRHGKIIGAKWVKVEE